MVHVCTELLSRINSLRLCGLEPVRLLCQWDSPGKNTVVGCHFLFQGIFQTQGLKLHLSISFIGRQILYHWATWESHCLFVDIKYDF